MGMQKGQAELSTIKVPGEGAQSHPKPQFLSPTSTPLNKSHMSLLSESWAPFSTEWGQRSTSN